MVQALKEEIRDAIMKSAKREFLKNGFQDTSMRVIAKGAGMSVGNVYHYFRSKEELFGSIVNKKIDQLNALLKKHTNNLLDIGKSVSHVNFSFQHLETFQNLSMVMELTSLFQDLMVDSRIELVLILRKSKGYKYGNSEEDLVEWIEGVVEKKMMFEMNKEHLNSSDQIYVRAIAKGFFESLCELIEQPDSEVDVKGTFEKLIKFYFM